MKDIALCHIDPANKAEGRYTVTANSDDGTAIAVFECDSERDAITLRNAIREHAARLQRVHNYRY